MSKSEPVAIYLDIFALYERAFSDDELERMLTGVFGWTVFSAEHPVTPVEFGQILMGRWMKMRMPFHELTRQTILNELGKKSKFVEACNKYATSPECFNGYLVSWFDDQHMVVSHENHQFYNIHKARWQPEDEKPKHTWMVAVDIAPLYVMGMQELKERQDARDLESSKSAEGGPPQ